MRDTRSWPARRCQIWMCVATYSAGWRRWFSLPGDDTLLPVGTEAPDTSEPELLRVALVWVNIRLRLARCSPAGSSGTRGCAGRVSPHESAVHGDDRRCDHRRRADGGGGTGRPTSMD